MPHFTSNAPIYGFDVIEINGNLTGMFLDVTPTVAEHNIKIPQVGEPRPVPDWGSFFSKQFVCCKPSKDDVQVGYDVLNKYLGSLTLGGTSNSMLAQQDYITSQKKNPQTFGMLKSHVGEETAKRYIETVLFPDII